MKPIRIEFTTDLPSIRNQQIGDYGEDEQGLWFRIYEFSEHPAWSMACLMHELWEKFRNDQLGITDAEVDVFDEANQEDDDPGMLPDAPYHRTHCESDALERTCIALAGEDWAEYDKAVNDLFEE